jgi:hypothetical protein
MARAVGSAPVASSCTLGSTQAEGRDRYPDRNVRDRTPRDFSNGHLN